MTNEFKFHGDGYFDESAEMFYEARFESYVDFVDRPALADPFEAQISEAAWDDTGCRLECAKWAWAADWVLLRFRKTGPDVDEDSYPTSTIVSGVFVGLHLARPLAEVVCLNAPDGWVTPWAPDATDEPSPGPTWKNRFGIVLPQGRYTGRERFDAETMFDEPFEARRRDHRRWNDEDMGR